MSDSHSRSLNDDTEHEDGASDQNAVLARENLSDKTREKSSNPGTKLQDGRQPALLGLVRRVLAHVLEMSAILIVSLRLLSPNLGMDLGRIRERSLRVPLTPVERRHGQHTREHALVVTVEHTANAGKAGDAEDAEVLPERAGTALAHHGLALVKRGIVEAGRAGVASGHCEGWFTWPCLSSIFNGLYGVLGYQGLSVPIMVLPALCWGGEGSGPSSMLVQARRHQMASYQEERRRERERESSIQGEEQARGALHI
jgi:hypothetical protein